MRASFFLLLCLSLCLWGPLAFPQQGEAQSREESIDFSAGRMSGSMKEGQDYTKLSGNAKIKTSSMEIEADVIELYGKDFRFIKAVGGVRGVQQEDGLTFSCGTMEYDREEKIALFSGSVVLDDRENDVVAKAQRIEYREQDAVALMQVDVELTREDSVSTCVFALYRKEEKMLEMTGNPQVVRGQDTFRAQEILFNLDTEEITMIGRVQGSVTEREE
ncbi:MAG: organic solvent tolerance protein OstA [Spirochaetaceae bacterium]|nr:organic solvent tolerance protein OstA [Spirochaetaceae bacterium]